MNDKISERWINRLFIAQKFEPNNPLDVKNQINLDLHRIAVVGKIASTKCVFRIYRHNKIESKMHFNNEVNVLEYLKAQHFDLQPIILKYDNSDLWFIQSYIEGNVAGALFDFDKEFVHSVGPVEIITMIRKIKKCKPKIANESKKLFSDYQDKVKFINTHWPTSIIKLDEWNSGFQKKINCDFKNKLAFAHSDISAGNLILEEKSNKIKLIDWESAKYEPYWRDFTSVYYRTYNFPEWQKKYIEELKMSAGDRISFFYYLTYFILSDTAGICRLLSQNNLKKINYYRSGSMTKSDAEKIIKNNIRRFMEATKVFHVGDIHY